MDKLCVIRGAIISQIDQTMAADGIYSVVIKLFPTSKTTITSHNTMGRLLIPNETYDIIIGNLTEEEQLYFDL